MKQFLCTLISITSLFMGIGGRAVIFVRPGKE